MNEGNLEILKEEFFDIQKELAEKEYNDKEQFVELKEKFNKAFIELNSNFKEISKHYTFFNFNTFVNYIQKKLSLCLSPENPLPETEYLKKVYEVYSKYDTVESFTGPIVRYTVPKYFEYHNYLDETNLMLLVGANSQKVEFLEKQLYERGVIIRKSKRASGIRDVSYSEDFERKMSYLNLKDSGIRQFADLNKVLENPEINAKLSDKIILLHELGIIDYLKDQSPFMQSTNTLAKCLSKILSAKHTSIQSCLNPIINPSSSQRNNPLNNDQNVKRIRSYLIELGYTPSKKG